jgi:hypothetical protein
MSKPPDSRLASSANPSEELTAIDPTDLAQVTGGTAPNDSTGLVAALNGLLDSVKQIQNTSKQNGINPQDMMLFMMLMQRQQQSSTTTVAAAPPWWAQGGTWIVR